MEPVVGDVIEELAQLAARPGDPLGLVIGGRSSDRGRVAGQQFEPLGVGQRLAQNGVGVADGLGRQRPASMAARLTEVAVQVLDVLGLEALE
ncbi:MAG: hypothetical protein GY708_02410 [Actinomycetia bacterium]|nr:hypothetical protein [Actinomycetes bacterium]MCP4961254.1 hypothetical protein [Actinomycetes bacterium]